MFLFLLYIYSCSCFFNICSCSCFFNKYVPVPVPSSDAPVSLIYVLISFISSLVPLICVPVLYYLFLLQVMYSKKNPVNQPQTPPAVTNKPATRLNPPPLPSPPYNQNRRRLNGRSRGCRELRKSSWGRKVIYSCFSYLETFNFLDFLDEKN